MIDQSVLIDGPKAIGDVGFYDVATIFGRQPVKRLLHLIPTCARWTKHIRVIGRRKNVTK